MSYELRPYQVRAVDQGIRHLKSYGKPFILVLATGAGKSLVIADICHKINEPILILQPSKEILEQNYQKLLSYDPDIDVGIYSASKKRKEIAKFTYATIGSIYKKPAEFMHFKYVIIDECHQVNPKNFSGMYKTFLDAIGCNNVCGLTATPYRLDPKYAHQDGQLVYTAHLKMINRIHPFFFKKIAYLMETQELIAQDYLAPIRYWSRVVDLEELEVNTTGKDFTTESLERFWNDKRLKQLAATLKQIEAECKLNLIFCSSIRQAYRAQEMLGEMGVAAKVVTGTTPMKEREQIIEDFKARKFKHLINVGVFTTGFDVPALDTITIARPTMSLALYYQMVGRGVRRDPENPDKVLTVYDFAGCVERLGRAETIRVVKEADGFKDKVISECGDMTGIPLFTFKVKRNKFKQTSMI